MTADRDQLARIILAGMNDIQEWRLGDAQVAAAKNYPREYDAELIDDWGIVFIDITLDARTGELVCHEVNGPNAVGSDALTGDSDLRAANEADQAVCRAREMGYLDQGTALKEKVVALHGHQHWKFFRTGGEFYPRVASFSDCMAERLADSSVGMFAAGDPLGEDDLSVVVGDIPSVSARLECNTQTRRFEYAGRPVIFLGNPNFLPELIRTGKFDLADRNPGNPMLRVLHGWKLAELIHAKGKQQDLFSGTGIRPLRQFAAQNIDDAVAMAMEMLVHGPVVIKPSNTSGGAGVEVVVQGMSEADIRARFEAMIEECRAKYGSNADAMLFPLGGFEFVQSTGYPMDDGAHLWDLRIAVQFEPGKALAYPVTLRLTPEAFDSDTFHTNRRQWVSNVSGRVETLLKSGMDDEALGHIGMTQDLIDKAMQACVRWTSKAWDCVARDGGHSGAVYEDFCEQVDEPFYHSERFTL